MLRKFKIYRPDAVSVAQSTVSKHRRPQRTEENNWKDESREQASLVYCAAHYRRTTDACVYQCTTPAWLIHYSRPDIPAINNLGPCTSCCQRLAVLSSRSLAACFSFAIDIVNLPCFSQPKRYIDLLADYRLRYLLLSMTVKAFIQK